MVIRKILIGDLSEKEQFEFLRHNVADPLQHSFAICLGVKALSNEDEHLYSQ